MIFRKFSQWKKVLDNSKIQVNKNNNDLKSVDNLNLNKVFIKGFSKDWSIYHLMKYFDPMNIKFNNINLITNNLGQNKSEAIVEFNNSIEAKKFIKKYHNDFINSNLGIKNIMVKLFELKTNENKINFQNNKSELMLYNLPYELTNNEINEMTKSYGKLKNLQMPLRDNSKNKGFCQLEFYDANAAIKFKNEFEDKLVYGRKIKIQSKYYKCDPSFSQIQTSKSNKFIENLKNDEIDVYNSLYKYNMEKYKNLK